MWRLSEEVARKIIKNVRSPRLGLFDLSDKDPFAPKTTKSVGFIDPYAAIGLDFDYILEMSYPFINPALPPVKVLDGYWLYRRGELQKPPEPFTVPRYLADPNIQNAAEQFDVTDCSIILPNEVEKLTCRSLVTFESLLKFEPFILECLNEDLQ